MTPKELKNSILQLAIEGKLVEQRKEDGSAEVLYAEIQKEKQKLIKQGKIKKKKPLPEITDDEIPFEIPKSWKWVRLKNIVYNNGQKKPNKEFSYIDIGSIDNSLQRLSSSENIISPDKAPSRARKIVTYGDILYSTVRPYLHNMCIIDKEFSYEPIASTGFAVMKCVLIYNKFLFYYLLSSIFDNYANDTENSKGVAYPAINDDKLYKAIVPLPPLAEQKRIVEKIEELMPLVDRYEVLYDKLNELNKEFPKKLKNAVLQKAIEGKLVPQIKSEGSTDDLYKEIQKEKQKLIKQGKIKKEKPLPEITEEEVPFEIPKSWKWCRINECFDMYTGNSISENIKKSKYMKLSKGYNYIGTKDVSFEQEINYNNGVKIPYNEEGFKIAEKGSILMCIEGGSAGRKIAVTNEEVCFGNKLCKFNQFGGNNKYLFYYLQSPQFLEQFKENLTGIIGGVSIQKIKEIIFPLPPLTEQKRIVEKIEEILPNIEKMENITNERG